MTCHKFGDKRDWFFEKPFGLFIHWGIYAVPGWHEQHQFRRGLSRQKYVTLMNEFSPTRFDADAWLDHAQRAGMEHLTVTAKHGDGFCLWDTDCTEYKVTNTPYRKDIIALLADACHRRDFPLCLYYSVPDMNQPNYPHAGRSYELPKPDPGDDPDLEKYLDFVRRQIHELCTRYGQIHGIWWDANLLQHRDPSFNQMIRELQPSALVNDRGFDEGDFDVSERDWDPTVVAVGDFPRPRQGCDSIGYESWGYRRDEHYYAFRYLQHSVDQLLARGGGYILNVGPCADGTFPQEAHDILENIGNWYSRVKESFLGTESVAGLVDNDEVLLTRNGDTLYVHQSAPLVKNGIDLAPIQVLPRRAILLNTGTEVEAKLLLLPRRYEDGDIKYLCLNNLPVNTLTNTIPVFRLDFDIFPHYCPDISRIVSTGCRNRLFPKYWAAPKTPVK